MPGFAAQCALTGGLLLDVIVTSGLLHCIQFDFHFVTPASQSTNHLLYFFSPDLVTQIALSKEPEFSEDLLES